MMTDPISALHENLCWTDSEMTQLAPSDDDHVVIGDLTLALPFD